MLDRDLAGLYGVATGNLNKAVSRNIERFPEDFMFQLTKEEFKNLIFHFGTSSWGGTRNYLVPLPSKALLCFQVSLKVRGLYRQTFKL